MKSFREIFLLLLVLFLFQGCRVFCWDNCWKENQYGRMKLTKMNFKKSFDPNSIEAIDTGAIYYHNRKAGYINTELYKIIRFFKTGQYAYFAHSEKPRENSSYDKIEYNNLEKATYAGYYNVKDSVIILEKPNHLSRRWGRRNLDKYKLLPNGDLKSVTRVASDYEAVYRKIDSAEVNLKDVEPDW